MPHALADRNRNQGHYIGIDEGHRRAQGRRAAGLLDIDDDSIVAALTAPLPHFVDELDGLEVPTWHELLRLCSAPGAPAGAPVPAIAQHLLDAFAAHEHPPALTVRQILDHLRQAEPDLWRRWDDQEANAQLREAGKVIGRALKGAGLTVGSTRLSQEGKPTGYRLEDLRTALHDHGVDLTETCPPLP